MYLPVCSDGTTLSLTPNNEMIYSLCIQGSNYNDVLGFFYIPVNIEQFVRKEKCIYCGSENIRKIKEERIKKVKAEYCCENCGEYFDLHNLYLPPQLLQESFYERLQESLYHIQQNYDYSDYKNKEICNERIKKMWEMYIKRVMLLTYNKKTNIKITL